jgi:hypothetical protein
VRRRPGSTRGVPSETEATPAPRLPSAIEALPDRWRIRDSVRGAPRWWDPYNFNTLKADRPLFGEDWFLNVRALSDTIFELRRLPTPVGVQANRDGGSLDAFGDDEQYALVENLLLSLSLIQGNTVFKPPDWELRTTLVGNWNYSRVETVGLLNIDPREGFRRGDEHLGLQEAFVDRHLANVSERYDFLSVRAGIQGFSADFRGFLFADNALGARLFGNYLNNRIQWNLGGFRRVEKDTNSGLNRTVDLRADDVYLANLYFQDFPVLGFTVQGTLAHNRNREGDRPAHYDENGFIQRPAGVGTFRPHNYEVTYLGLNGDGHLGPVNLTFSGYRGVGDDDLNPIAGRPVDVENFMVAAEASVDRDWYRLKAFGLYASGDDDPFDGRAEGWDPIFENPNFAGADTSFWVRQAIPLVGGGGVALSGRNALIPSLRSSKEEGQSNFVNPGLVLWGVGGDFDLLPQLRLVTNVSWLRFADTATLRVLRNQGPIDDEIGVDVSGALLYRPLFTENIVLRLSGAALLPGQGLQELFADEDRPFYSAFVNVILAY